MKPEIILIVVVILGILGISSGIVSCVDERKDVVTEYKTNDYSLNGQTLIVNNTQHDKVSEIHYSNGTLYAKSTIPEFGIFFWICVVCLIALFLLMGITFYCKNCK